MKAKLCAEEISEARGGAQGRRRRRWLQADSTEATGASQTASGRTYCCARCSGEGWGGEDYDMPHPTPNPRRLAAEREDRQQPEKIQDQGGVLCAVFTFLWMGGF